MNPRSPCISTSILFVQSREKVCNKLFFSFLFKKNYINLNLFQVWAGNVHMRIGALSCGDKWNRGKTTNRTKITTKNEFSTCFVIKWFRWLVYTFRLFIWVKFSTHIAILQQSHILARSQAHMWSKCSCKPNQIRRRRRRRYSAFGILFQNIILFILP